MFDLQLSPTPNLYSKSKLKMNTDEVSKQSSPSPPKKLDDPSHGPPRKGKFKWMKVKFSQFPTCFTQGRTQDFKLGGAGDKRKEKNSNTHPYSHWRRQEIFV